MKRRGRRRAATAVAGSSAAATSGVAVPATIPLADLSLRGPGGAVANLEPYSCTLAAGSSCAVSGQLEPATPLAQYFASYPVQLAPPRGESWVRVPAGCSAGAVPACVLTSEPVAVSPL